MGRCGGWMKILALLLAAFTASCGDTGGGPSGSGKPFVFQGRGRLNLIAQLVPATPTVIKITATLLDPQGNPFRNQRVTFEAEFRDATIIPANTPENISLACLPPDSNGNATRCTNRGAAITNDSGQAQVTVIAGLTLGSMRITAEAPANLNIASAMSVQITSQGFIGGTALAIFPTAVVFLNPFVRPGEDGPFTIFTAVGGFPPYQWSHSDVDLAKIQPQGIPNINEQAKYTLTGPLPANGTIPPDSTEEVLNDVVRLTDSRGGTVTAPVNVIFATCTLQLSLASITVNNARGREAVDVIILNGVPPFTATQASPAAGAPSVDNTKRIITYTVSDPPVVAADVVIVRDSRGCVGTFTVSVTPATVANIVVTASATSLLTTELPATVTITATAFDSDNQPFEGVTLLFTTTEGTLNPLTAITGADGKTTPPITLTIPAGTEAGSITVTATAPGGKTGKVVIDIEEPD